MLDVAPTELLLVAIVALLVIGPKDLPKAMRFVGHWVGKARGVARQFRAGFDTMVRESELAEMEKKWAEENARIMREHPVADTGSPALPSPDGRTADHAADSALHGDGDAVPTMVEKPVVEAADGSQDPATSEKAPS